jgi:DNA-binding IscR family transcriptional regulator
MGIGTDCYSLFMAHPTNTQFAVAVHLLTLLAQQPTINLDSVALSVSPSTNPVRVRRILGQLRDAGLVHSHVGPGGGWSLALAPDQIDLARVWCSVNRDDPILGQHQPDPNCPTGQLVAANLRALDRRAYDALIRELGEVTIADVLAGRNVTTA